MKPVFHYIDYRQFLRDYYEEKKRNTRHFSYRYFSAKAGIGSPVFLKLVIEGKRNISPAMAGRFAEAVRLNKSESRYFWHLVLFNQAKEADEKQEHYAVLIAMSDNVSKHALGSEQFEYLDRWYNVVVRELVCQRDFSGDFKALASSVVPAITQREAESSVRLLCKLGLITRQTDGAYRQVDKALLTNRDIAGPVVRAFNKTMIDRAHEAVDAQSNDERNISGMTIGITRACYEVLCAEIEAFKDRVATIVDKDAQSDSVYQLNMQLFRVGRAKAGNCRQRPIADDQRPL
jgi:uncharacterized protein (TIGR02147 family)